MKRSPENTLATRASLLARLKDWNDQESWREFFDNYGGMIYRVALKAGLTESEAEDAVQETLVAAAKNIGTFKYDPEICSFKGWLMLIARQRIIWQIRKRLPSCKASANPATATARTSTVERIPDPNLPDWDSVWDEEWQKTLFSEVIERVKHSISPRQFQIFDLHVLRNWPVREVAQTLNINSAQVYLAKHRVTAMLRKEIKHLSKPGAFAGLARMRGMAGS